MNVFLTEWNSTTWEAAASLPAQYTPLNALGQGTSRNVGSHVISQKRQLIPHNQSEYADSQILVIGVWHYHSSGSFVNLLSLCPCWFSPDETSWPLNSFGMTKAAFVSHPPPLYCWARSFVHLVSLSCLSILSSSSVYSFFLATSFPIYVLFWVACTPLLSNVTLFFEVPISMVQVTRTCSCSWFCHCTWEVTKWMTLVIGNMLCRPLS